MNVNSRCRRSPTVYGFGEQWWNNIASPPEMFSPSTDLLQEWRVANRAAIAAEKDMLNASILALDGKGEPPSQAEALRVKRLRATADDLFQQAMTQMAEMAIMARTTGKGMLR